MSKTRTINPSKESVLSLSKGFTLVELLVVIAIIGTLATLLLLQLGTARAKARDTKRIADINQMRSANEQYFDDNGAYIDGNVIATMKTRLVPKYIVNIPQDPLTPSCGNYSGAGCYGYAINTAIGGNPTKYQLWAELETKNSNALNGDADFTGSDLTPLIGGVNQDGALESCPDNDLKVINCVYDAGQK